MPGRVQADDAVRGAITAGVPRHTPHGEEGTLAVGGNGDGGSRAHHG